MPAKLNIGLSRKVGEANYGSRGASINLEVEVDSATLSEPQLLRDRVRSLYAMARQSVEDELQRPADDLPTDAAHSNGNGHANGNGHHAAGQDGGTATQSQVRAIFAIARRQRLDPSSLVRDRFRVQRPEDLSIREASSLIDDLKRGSVEVRS